MVTEAHPAAEREPDRGGVFRGDPDPDPEPADIFRGMPEPDPEPRPRGVMGCGPESLIGALAGLVLADLDARRGGAR